ncbi:hypothetical protein [Actinomadura keratinilytica]|uniref:Uncharacterized protein n=1 Tax=Actinomadura keratinilytica TaxID=547461 RepID=A0ABP7ZE78_9ACTN
MTTAPQWSGEMLDRPEMVQAFSAQLRQVLASHADYVARIRRDAEAMWDENPPEGYSTFEAWWRAKWVKGPLADIQEHLEKAAALTFRLEARYRKGRHEIPARRLAAKQAKELPQGQQAPVLGSGQFGRRTQPGPASGAAAGQDGAADGFLDMIRKDHSA